MKFKRFLWTSRGVLMIFILSIMLDISCKKEVNTEKLGNLKGVIRNEFNQPIQGAVITIGIRSNTSETNGSYRFSDLPAGTCQVSVTAASYLTQIQTVDIIEDTDNQLDFEMVSGEPSLELSSSRFDATYQASHESINVISNADWLVVDSSAWIDCEPMEGSGNQQLSINWITNTGDEKRIDSVFVRSGNVSKKIVVSQGFPLRIVTSYGIIGNDVLYIQDSALVIFNKPVTIDEIISEYEYCISTITYNLVQGGYGVRFSYGCADLGREYPFKIRVTDNEGLNFNADVSIAYYESKVVLEGSITDFIMSDDRKNCWISTKNPDRIYYIPGDSLVIKKTFNLDFHPRRITLNPYNQKLYVLGGDLDTYNYDSTVYVIDPVNGAILKYITILPEEDPEFSEYFPYSIGFSKTGYGVILLQSDNSSGIDWRIMDSANDDTVFFHEAHGFGNGQYPYFSDVYLNYDRSRILLTEMYGSCVVDVLDGTTHEITEFTPGSQTRGVFITPNMTNDRIYFGQLYDQFIQDLDGNMSQISYKVNFGENSADFSYIAGKEDMIYWLNENENYLEILDYRQSVSPFSCGAMYGLRGLTATLDGRFLFACKIDDNAAGSSLYKFNTGDLWKHAK